MHSAGVVRGISATGGPSGRGTEAGGGMAVQERMVCIIDYFYHQCYTKILYNLNFLKFGNSIPFSFFARLFSMLNRYLKQA